MNPYDFVPVDWNSPPQRRAPTPHHKFTGVSGRIEGTITAETPLLIRDPRSNKNRLEFLRNKGKSSAYIIPGSSLKGMIRNLVETVGNGCFKLFDGEYSEHSWPTDANYKNKVPRDFQECPDANNLCIGCRMFGTLAGNYLGNVSIDDAVCTEPVKHDTIILPPLYKPRPYHEAWYLSADKKTIAGRKFYFHQPAPYYFKKMNPRLNPRRRNSNDVQATPLNVGSQFTFSLTFENLAPQDEFPGLLYALVLEPEMRHKIGYAKSAGLGTIRIDITKLVRVDYSARYLRREGTETLTGEALQDYLQGQTQHLANNQSATFAALRRIWKWPPHKPPTGFGYPTRDWFNKNSNASIAESWDAPRQF